MAQCMKLLIDVRDTIESMFGYPKFANGEEFDYSALADVCRKDATNLEEVHRTVRRDAEDMLQEQLPEVIGYTKGTHNASDKVDFLPGFMYPDELMHEADDWNVSIIAAAVHAIVDFIGGRPENMPMEEYILQMADFTDESARPCSTGLIAYNLRHAFSAVDGVFTYGDGRYVIDNITVCSNTGIIPQVMENIKAHPEWYAILNVTYE